MTRHHAPNLLRASIAALLTIAASASAAPRLYLTATDGSSALSVSPGSTTTLTLQLHGNTGTDPISGLFFHIEAPTPITYGQTPAVIGSPFPGFDSSPAAGAAVDDTQLTSFFKSGSGDYAALAGEVLATYEFSVSGLAADTYTFTPVGEGMTNSLGVATDTFAAPGTFAFTVTAIPEPAAVGAMLCAGMIIMRRRSA